MKTLILGSLLAAGLAAAPAFADNSSTSAATVNAAPQQVAQVYYDYDYDRDGYRHHWWHHHHRMWRHHNWEWVED